MIARTLLLATASALAVSTGAFAAAPTTEQFVHDASIANMFEIKSSEIALKRSKNADVRSFAQEMVTDHGKAGKKLETTLKTAKTKVTPQKSLDNDHQEQLSKLEAASDDDFDDDYIDAQQKAHEQAVNLFSDYSKDGNDAAIKQFASDTLPTLKKHKDMVDKLDDKN